MRDIDKIKERVQKLLNQASDREGTPEGDAFYAKAFGLMATYGFAERELGATSTGDDIMHKEYQFHGSYTDMQSRLLLTIARALHCTGFYQRKYNSTKVESATVFGLRRHMDRVDLLYALLLPVMLAGAQRLRAESFIDSVVVMRRSFMTGFAAQVGERLAAAEATVAHDQKAREAYALALIDDAALAEHAAEHYAAEHDLILGGARSQRSLDVHAYAKGWDAGGNTDLGQARVAARPALPF